MTVDASVFLARALEGDPSAVRALVDALLPVVRARVARSLARRGRAVA